MDRYSQEWNAHYVDFLIPNIIWTIVCFILGFVGNSFVLLFYICRIKRQYREDRYFIPILAFTDLTANLFSTIHNSIDYLYLVTFPSSQLCTALFFLSFFTSAASTHFLLVIGIQRYLNVCRPRGFHMTLFWRRVAIIVTMCAVTSYSIPILFAAGNKTVEWTFNEQNVTGIICSLNAQDNPEFSSIYYPGTLVVLVAIIIATVVVYFPVGYVIYKRFYNKKWNKYAVNNGKTNLQTTKISIVDDLVQEMKSGIKSDKHCSEINEFNKHVENTETQTKGVVDIGETDLNNSSSTFSIPKSKPNSIKGRRKTKIKVNFNVMFITIVIFYLLSYIPTGVMLIVSATDPLYWFKLSDKQFGILICLQRFYIVNQIVNPFIYAFFYIYFRESIKSFFKCKKS